MREQFLALQVKGRLVTGVTSDGRFVRVRWRGPLPAVGALVSEPGPVRAPRVWAFAAAATVVLLILALQLPFLEPFAQAGTLVAVDINPSLELLLTASGRVVRARALNVDAQRVLATLTPLPSTLPELLAQVLGAAEASGALKTDSDNLVLVGVVPGWRGMPTGLDPAALEAALAGEFDRLGIDGLVRVVKARPADLAQACLNALSLNRYLLVRDLKAQGRDVTYAEARAKSPGQLIRDHGLAPDQVIRGRRGGPRKHGGLGPSQPSPSSQPGQPSQPARPASGSPGRSDRGGPQPDDNPRSGSGSGSGSAPPTSSASPPGSPGSGTLEQGNGPGAGSQESNPSGSFGGSPGKRSGR